MMGFSTFGLTLVASNNLTQINNAYSYEDICRLEDNGLSSKFCNPNVL